ncbi:MFS transporter [Actinocorallia aurantiaca]|uniref:MFS transporter n=1 Tax=Actinocorallia aurantiaca TaxID=46204 RepID=A0ABN3UE45_9ACTN
MIDPYRELLLEVPGARYFVPAGVVGRMAMSMMGIGIVLMVTATYGGYGLAGAVAATCSLCSAFAAPFVARWVDRFGQRRVLVPLVLADTAAMLALVLCAVLALPAWTLFPAAFLVGVTTPSMSGLVRARWSHLLADRESRLGTAFSLESVLDEIVFITGPVLVTVLATAAHPSAGLVAAAGFTLVGCLFFAAQRSSEPPPHPHQRAGRSALLMPGMPRMAAVFLFLGVIFGSVEVGAIAFAEEAGRRSLAGVVLASYAAGSGAAGLWYGARSWKRPLPFRFRAGLALMTAGLVPLVLIEGLPPMLFVIFFSGLAISPTIIPAYGVLERLVSGPQLTEGLTWASTAIGLGMAAGAAAGGRLIDARGSAWSFGLALGAGLLAVLAVTAKGSRFDEDL